MQLTLLIVNFFLITIISREYGAEIYGEYASSKSLSVLIGTAIVMSLALVVTKALAKNSEDSKIEEIDRKESPKSLKGEDFYISQNVPKCIEMADIHIKNRFA